MVNLHELATTIGNTWLLCGLSALAAGLAAIALICGAAKVKRTNLSKNFPADPEARVDKYVLSFSQLDKNAVAIDELAELLKNQPAAHLCLTAFARATDSIKSVEEKTAKKGRGKQ